jgi:hypothetical protein
MGPAFERLSGAAEATRRRLSIVARVLAARLAVRRAISPQPRIDTVLIWTSIGRTTNVALSRFGSSATNTADAVALARAYLTVPAAQCRFASAFRVRPLERS